MRAQISLLALLLLIAACDSASNDPIGDPALGGLYQSVAETTPDPATASVVITLDIPPVAAGAFKLGDMTGFEATSGSLSSSVKLSGRGVVKGTAVTVTIDGLPAVFVTGSGIALEFLGSGPETLTGVLVEGGAVIVFETASGQARYERLSR